MPETFLFQGQPVIRLADAENTVLISAVHGAKILKWIAHGREVITWPDDADWTKAIKVRGGNPILFPFIARHFVDGQIDKWRDRTGIVRDMPSHGFCRDAEFAVVETSDKNVRMRYVDNESTQAMFPFSFQFDVVVTLQEESCLEVRLEVTNTGAEPMPWYAGHHFYFAIPHESRKDWRLNCPCSSWARQDKVGAITHEEPKSELLRLDDPEISDRFQVHPLGSRISLFNTHNNQRLILEIKSVNTVPWYAITTWTQAPESDFYCIEPWLGLPNAIHHQEGLRWLKPGSLEEAVCVLDARNW